MLQTIKISIVVRTKFKTDKRNTNLTDGKVKIPRCNACGLIFCWVNQWPEKTKDCSKFYSYFVNHSFFFFFLSIWVFFHEHSRITRLQGKGEGISLTPHYHFCLLHRHLDISQAITAEISPLHIASSRTWTGNIWFKTTHLLMKHLIRHF